MEGVFPLEFLHECCDCVGSMRPYIVMEQNDPTGELAWLFRFDLLAKGGHCCSTLQEFYQKGLS